MRFYVSKCHDTLNGITYSPETITPYLCLNPYYPASLKKNSRVKYILDSGAFQDVKTESRLTPEDALQRQLNFERKVGRRAESIVSYDRLVDEQTEDGVQFKERVSESIGKEYVEETIESAKYLVSQRKRLKGRQLVLSCQGTNADQYLECMEAILDIATPDDVIGLGGFCILSKSITYENEFYEVINKGFPLIRENGNTRVHIFGMGVFRVLVQTDIFARTNGIDCSYDTSSPELNAVFGKCFNPVEGQMASVFSKIQKMNGYVPAELAMLNVRMITDYWKLITEMPLPETDFHPGINKSRKERMKIKENEERCYADRCTIGCAVQVAHRNRRTEYRMDENQTGLDSWSIAEVRP